MESAPHKFALEQELICDSTSIASKSEKIQIRVGTKHFPDFWAVETQAQHTIYVVSEHYTVQVHVHF